MLETFKKKAQLLADAQNNKVEKLYQLSDYELTVKNAIKRAEMEEGDEKKFPLNEAVKQNLVRKIGDTSTRCDTKPMNEVVKPQKLKSSDIQKPTITVTLVNEYVSIKVWYTENGKGVVK